MYTNRFLAICALALLMVFSTGQSGSSAAWDLEELTAWPGFGDAWNRYTYTQVYYEGNPNDDSDDAIYLGTFNQREAGGLVYDWYDEANAIEYGTGSIPPPFGDTKSKGGRVWKYTISTGHWKLVWPRLNTVNFNPNDFGWRIAAVYQGKIYFGSYTSSGDGARLMVITPINANLESVSFIEPGPPLTQEQVNWWNGMISIRAMAVYNGKLYLGSEFPGRLWSYDGTNLEWLWNYEAGGLNYNIAELEVYGGYLYIGCWFDAALYRMNAAETEFLPINLGPAATEEGVISLEVFDNKLFVGMADRPAFGGDGFSLFYYDGVADTGPPDPTHIITTDGRPNPPPGEDPPGPGQGDNINGYAWFLKQCGGLLFMGVYTETGGVDEGLWATSDGDNWTNLTDHYNPTPSEYGGRSLACGIPADGTERLFYGTADNLSPSTTRFPGGTRILRIEGPFTSIPDPS